MEKVQRPWGWYQVIDEGDRYKTKNIEVIIIGLSEIMLELVMRKVNLPPTVLHVTNPGMFIIIGLNTFTNFVYLVQRSLSSVQNQKH